MDNRRSVSAGFECLRLFKIGIASWCSCWQFALVKKNIHKLGYIIKYGGQLVIDPDTCVGKF